MRPSWHEYFFSMARTVATRSSCPRLSVGCVLVQDRRIIATGYNGAVTGAGHCLDVGCEMSGGHCVRAVHAEVNALLQAARHGCKTDGAVAFVTHRACKYCSMCLTNAGIREVSFEEEY
jgi:dCMP deaminase